MSLSQATCSPSPCLMWLPEAPVELLRDTPFPFQISFQREHLEACLLSLGCDVMARERSNFETYSMCYEHILQHARQKLSQKEQVGAQRSAKEKTCGPGGTRVTRQRKSEMFLCQTWGALVPSTFLSIGFFSWALELSVTKVTVLAAMRYRL